MPGDLADQAFGHCLAVLGDPDAAAEAAVAALRRAGRSRSSVLAHARYQALDQPAPPAPAPDTPAPDDLTELAALLAATRPAVERAVLDLRARLDRADLGRALGLPAAVAADRADAVGEAWGRELDPLLLTRLGPGDCLLLAAVLADADLAHPTLADLEAIGPAVSAHVAGCDACADRLRAMVSVRALTAQTDDETAPDVVRDAARRSRRMRPAQAPPALEPSPRRPLVIAAVIAAVLALVVGIGATAAALTGDRGGRAKRVAELVQVPTGSRLALTIRRDTVEVVNRSNRDVAWRASTDVPWLRVMPSEGRLAAGDSTALATRVLHSSPEGPLRATVTVSSSDGSAAAARYETSIERPPDLAVALEGCTVGATVEDGTGVDHVVLHWTDPSGAHMQTMSGDATYTASLPAGRLLAWWVIASDTRGNQSRSPESRTTC